MSTVTVRVPASATNLGPGFDVFGMALRLHNHIRLQEAEPGAGCRVVVSGEGAGLLEPDERNLVCRAARRLFEVVGQPFRPLRVEMQNHVPVSRGLGSSSTAIVGGLAAANALLGGPLDREALLLLAVEIEGHPDNVTPALLGGFQVTSLTEHGLLHLRLPAPEGLRAVVCIPEVEVSTRAARNVLPEQYSRADAVFNVGRAALLVSALTTGRTDLLRSAMEDRLHQPYRAPLIPGFAAALEGALAAGAVGACLSGSGSTLLALAVEGGGAGADGGDTQTAIGEAMVAAVSAAGCGARWLALDLDLEGTVVSISAAEPGAVAVSPRSGPDTGL
jgi:homoserine kinase